MAQRLKRALQLSGAHNLLLLILHKCAVSSFQCVQNAHFKAYFELVAYNKYYHHHPHIIIIIITIIIIIVIIIIMQYKTQAYLAYAKKNELCYGMLQK